MFYNGGHHFYHSFAVRFCCVSQFAIHIGFPVAHAAQAVAALLDQLFFALFAVEQAGFHILGLSGNHFVLSVFFIAHPLDGHHGVFLGRGIQRRLNPVIWAKGNAGFRQNISHGAAGHPNLLHTAVHRDGHGVSAQDVDLVKACILGNFQLVLGIGCRNAGLLHQRFDIMCRGDSHALCTVGIGNFNHMQLAAGEGHTARQRPQACQQSSPPRQPKRGTAPDMLFCFC